MRYTSLLLATLLVPLATLPVAAQDVGEDDLLTCGYLCGDDGMPLSTAGDMPPATDLVTKIFLGAFSEACDWAIGGGPSMYAPEVFDFTYRPLYIEADEPDEDLRVYRFFCGAGAYNQRHVYLTWTSSSGVEPVSFAVPSMRYAYAGENGDSELTSLTMTGMAARQQLVNSTFDAETGAVTEWSCWRGLCDASNRAEWRLSDGTFELVTYDEDPTYDGEVNLFRVVDYSAPTDIDISTPLPFEPPADEELETN